MRRTPQGPAGALPWSRASWSRARSRRVCDSPRDAPKLTPDAMAAPKLRCGVAGVGSLGQHHARIYASMPGAELAGIYDASDARATEISTKLGCRKFASIDELGASCDAVSVVVATD